MNSPGANITPEAAAAPQLPILGLQIGESTARELELHVGLPGKPGTYLARFTNQGAKLVELRLGNFYDLST